MRQNQPLDELGSISQILVGVKQGDELAAEQLWNRLIHEVAEKARRRLRSYGVRGVDDEDIAVDVFASLCRGAPQGRFPKLNDRDDLWQILLMLTRQKVIDRRRRRPPDFTESAIAPLIPGDESVCEPDWFECDEPRPDAIAAAVETLEHLLESLDETRRQIALLRMDGHSNPEIAERLGISKRSVERKVPLIKEHWRRSLSGFEGEAN